ncbi:MAG: gamma carbonic anhydrase family protein [Candidatus Eremiobacter antarcticus]|nr:gamma carbonic anhydrase family protein [Candidatus Eremiobacteraeota bacterium]MBC5808137.1 gamma carbonic anhydrase family protein [Candidatus Eremiobacteraeota bacterium]PZR63534.1 MAG: gamma carbonic anhydrase family protein [Candidatus Eremiobacter sp. RRmetagenome_bin22]
MACILTFDGKSPKIGKGVFIAPTASIIGDVELADGVSVWFGAVLRGDEAAIHIGENTSVQDNAVIHVYEGHDTVIEDNVTIGHGAILEACHVKSGALIGMNAVVLDRAVIGRRALVAAGSVVLEDQEIPDEMLAAGAPAALKKRLEGSSQKWLTVGAPAYVRLTKHYRSQGIGLAEDLHASAIAQDGLNRT